MEDDKKKKRNKKKKNKQNKRADEAIPAGATTSADNNHIGDGDIAQINGGPDADDLQQSHQINVVGNVSFIYLRSIETLLHRLLLGWGWYDIGVNFINCSVYISMQLEVVDILYGWLNAIRFICWNGSFYYEGVCLL